MSSIQMTQLPVAIAFSGAEVFEVVQNGTSVRATIAQFVGSATGLTTPFGIAIGGTGASTAAGARTNLGLGTIAVQNANAVAITGGNIDGAPIGATTPSTGIFTTVAATAAISGAST
jgi:hypothetical protein